MVVSATLRSIAHLESFTVVVNWQAKITSIENLPMHVHDQSLSVSQLWNSVWYGSACELAMMPSANTCAILFDGAMSLAHMLYLQNLLE